jgi:cytoskeleton protein RodZ
MHIAVLAASIKVAQRKLEALEADRYEELPDITFARALAQAVCRALKIDAEPVLSRLPQGGAGQAQGLVHVSGGLNAPFRDRPGREEPNDHALFRRPVFWATALVLLAAAVLALAPDNLRQRLDTAPAEPAVADVTTTPAPLPQAPASEAAPAAAPPAQATSEAAAPQAAAPAPAAVLRATEPSWVEVRDAVGRVLLSRTLQPEESVDFGGALPLQLTIGNARATELRFRGQPVDLAPATGRDNVARLELK